MRKLSALAVTLVAVLAVGGIAADAAQKREKVKSKVTLRFDQGAGGGSYYEEAAFRGTVTTRGKASKRAKKACRKRRTVVITQLGAGRFGQAKTDARGRFVLPASDAYNAPGRYTATARKQRKGRIVCRKATSKPVEAF